MTFLCMVRTSCSSLEGWFPIFKENPSLTRHPLQETDSLLCREKLSPTQFSASQGKFVWSVVFPQPCGLNGTSLLRKTQGKGSVTSLQRTNGVNHRGSPGCSSRDVFWLSCDSTTGHQTPAVFSLTCELGQIPEGPVSSALAAPNVGVQQTLCLQPRLQYARRSPDDAVESGRE